MVIDLQRESLQPTVSFPGIRVCHYVLLFANKLEYSSVLSHQVFRHQWSHLDLKAAFRHVPINLCDYWLLLFEWN